MSKDPKSSKAAENKGAETLQRYRYQAVFGAIIAVESLSLSSDIAEIFCEHHEDILVRHTDGRYHGYQVKTRGDGMVPFKATDDEILKCLSRFARLETQYPDRFYRYTIVSNCGFWSEKNNGSCLQAILAEAATITLPADAGIARLTDTLLKRVQKNHPETSRGALIKALQKTKLHPSSGLNDIELRLIERLASLEPLKTTSYPDVRRAGLNLTSRVLEASATTHASVLRDYFSLLADPTATQASNLVESKRIAPSVVLDIVNRAASTGSLLSTKDGVAPSDLPDTMHILERKMAMGGISPENILSIKDLKHSSTLLCTEWINKYGADEAQKRINHSIVVARSDAHEAHDEAATPSGSYGQTMLNILRSRVRDSENGDPYLKRIGCTFRHLLGFVGHQTEACNVWWSKKFSLGGPNA